MNILQPTKSVGQNRLAENELKRAFTENQLPDLERDLAAFIADHIILRDLPAQDQKNAAHCAAIHLLLAIRGQSVVGLVR